MVLGLCFGLATSAIAQVTDSTTVAVTVEEVETLEAPADVTITMNYTTGETGYVSTILPETSQITYAHNSETQKKITATATEDTGNAESDIIITVVVADGAIEPDPIVTGGVGQTDILLWDSIGRGTNISDVTWTADATIAGTPAGSYTFTVTFTATDVEATP